MNIKFDEVPSPSRLIVTMDKHPVGAALFIAGLSNLLVGLAVLALMYFK